MPRGGLGRGIESLIRTGPGPRPTDILYGTGAAGRGTASDEPAGEEQAGDARAGEAPPADATSSADTATADTATAEPASPVPATDEPPSAEVRSEPQLPASDRRPEFRDIPVESIQANSRQPRTVFDEESLAELAHSVREFGVLQPVVVRPATGGYELVMGERRLRAARLAGLDTIPAVIRHTQDDAMLRDALLENLHRAQLNPLEEAAAYQQLLDEFGVTHDELASRIGRSRSQVSNTVRLMNLSVPVQRRVAAGVLSAGHARALLALADADAQDELAARIVAEGLSVRATEELVSLTSKGLLEAPTRRRPVRRFTAPAATDLAEKLSDRFDTTVRVDLGRRKGRVTIEFASIDDLERIVSVMAPELVPARAAAAEPSTGGGPTE